MEWSLARMPHSVKWQRMLSGSYGEQKADALISSAGAYYAAYCAGQESKNSRNDQHSYKTRVFPGLAIYQALLDENSDQEKVLAEVSSLFRAAFFNPTIAGIRMLNSLPDPFFILRPVLKLMNRDALMVGSQVIVEDNADCFALNVYCCPILDTLTKHNARELTELYCRTDDWLAEALPKVGWRRTRTLAQGGDYCDFRWYRIK